MKKREREGSVMASERACFPLRLLWSLWSLVVLLLCISILGRFSRVFFFLLVVSC
jgi:hypothetical protein